jgi:drug/metabolite transporter (DMT)-like permease
LPKSSSRRPLAIVAIIALMIVWGATFVVTKAAATEIPPSTLALLRFLIASAVLVPIAWSRGGLALLPRPIPLGALALMALSGIALYTIAFNYALVYASATQGALIYAVLPAAIALAAVAFLKERPTRRRIAGILLSICGVALVIAAGEKGGDSPHPLLGAWWMIGAVVAWTAYTVIAKRLAGANQIIVTTSISLLGVLMLAPLSGVELMQTPWPTPSLQAWAGMLFLGVIASALAYIVYSFALRELDATLVGVFTNLDPIVGVLTAVVFLGETLHGGHVTGGAIALVGMWLASSESSAVERT